MIKFPIIVLSYGRFSETKKLFMYENGGIPIMPVFLDAKQIKPFIRHMEKKLKELGDSRRLLMQVCSKPSTACDIFKVITTVCPDLQNLSVNPYIKKDLIIDCEILPIAEVIEHFDK